MLFLTAMLMLSKVCSSVEYFAIPVQLTVAPKQEQYCEGGRETFFTWRLNV